MLSSLTIKNYALIESLQIDFNEGFTAITGETGAGKSILLGALALVLGKRADLSTLRDKNKKCIVEADFNLEKLSIKPFFDTNDLDYGPVSTLRREILPSGKSRAFINDTPVSLNVMKELGDILVDIHSQHQTLLLGDSQFQINLFDSYINKPEVSTAYRNAYKNLKQTETKLNELKTKKEQLSKDEDYLRFQLNELKVAEEDILHFDELKTNEQSLIHAEDIAEGIKISLNALSENELSALQQIATAKEAISKAAAYDKNLEELYQRLEPLYIELKDIVAELETQGSEIDFNPALIDLINEKLDAVYRLQKKHGVNQPDELLTKKDEISRKLEEAESVDNLLEEVQKQYEAEKELTEQKAALLSRLRKENIALFEKKVTGLLSRLGMPHAVLKVKMEPAGTFTDTGTDKISFMFSANKGIAVQEIGKVASGGEFSRLMLALKAMVRQNNMLPTIIFDEIDSGISGEIAGKTGNILKEMSEKIQVIAITHLPQIAAKADTHIKVYKESGGDKTSSNLKELSVEERVLEIAKLISDKDITQAAIDTAKSLLKG